MRKYFAKVNLIIFPFIFILGFCLSVLESYKYIGFFQKHFYISPYSIYLLTFISFIGFIMSKKQLESLSVKHLLQKFLGIGTIMFFISLLLYIALNEMEIINYSNFSYTTFHIWPGSLIFPIMLLFEVALLFFSTNRTFDKLDKQLYRKIKMAIHHPWKYLLFMKSKIRISGIWSFFGKNKLILYLMLIAIFILGYPLVVYGIDKTFFYSMDPDVVYTTNALLYTKAKVITYLDHPGTPTIVILYYLYFPLRIIAKYWLHISFIQWSFDNFAFLTYYLRIFQLVISSVGLLIFLNLIKTMVKSKTSTIIAFCLIFAFGGMTTAITIVPENFSFLLVACWLTVFYKFTKNRKYLWNIILAVISGFAFANKFTNIFLIIASLFLPFFITGLKLKQKALMVGINSILSLLTFFLGIWPIKDKLTGIVEWGKNLFTHAGSYGSGTQSIFDPLTYFSSVAVLIRDNPILFIFICFSLVFFLFLVIKKKLDIKDPVVFLVVIAFVGIATFAKYTVIRYNYIHIQLIIFSLLYFLSKLKVSVTKILLPVTIVIFLIFSFGYIKTANQLSKMPTETVHDVLNAWTPFWASDIFREQLDAVKP